MAVELEFYLVDRERTPEGHAQPPRQPLTGRREVKTQINSMQELDEYSTVLSAIDAAAREQELPVGTVLAEYGPGQFEVNLHHVDDPLLACDHAIRLKRLVKGVALAHGMEATFMPKPYRDHAGSGAHLHVSVLDAQGDNIFAAEDPVGSEQLRHAIGGLAATMNDAIAICAPTANSYRRFQPEAYVPLNPSWSVNNRGVAFRVPHGPPASRRVEHRIAGADANPYLLAAIVLAGMHLGSRASSTRVPCWQAMPTATRPAPFRCPGRKRSACSNAASLPGNTWASGSRACMPRHAAARCRTSTLTCRPSITTGT